MLLYIFYFCIALCFILYIYIRLKYRFWVIQPVYHYYDIIYWFRNVGIIRKELPSKNRYTNLKDINFIEFKQLYTNKNNSRLLKQFIFLIQDNYLKNKENAYLPQQNNIIPYFKGHKYPCYISFYNEPILLEDNRYSLKIDDKRLIGAMTSRPLTISFLNNEQMNVYYVDYLCVHKLYRKKNIAPQLIQTHEYHQSHKNKAISVSIFKREGDITAIIPFTIYNTYCFDMSNWLHPMPLDNTIKMIHCDSSNIYYLYTFIEEQKKSKHWKLVCLPSIANLLELVKSKNIFITMTIINQEIISAYFFRKVCTSISKDKEVLSLFASINSNISNNNIFIHGFKVSLSEIVKKNKCFYFLCVENISDNDILLNNLFKKSSSIIKTKMAYYFYNFAYNTLPSNSILMIN